MNLGIIKSHISDKAAVIAFSKEWLDANEGKPLEFEAKIEKNRLVLSANLESLDRTKEVDTNEM
jgi:hypothetical protein